MQMKSQIMIGGGALLGLVGLYFAWNFYAGNNIKLEVTDKEPENEVVNEEEK